MTKFEFEHIDSKLDTIIDKLDSKPSTKALAQAKTTILKELRGEAEDVESMNGPSTKTRFEQVELVKRVLENAIRDGRAMSLNEACLEAWEDLTGGYPSPKALYVYCHAHAKLFPLAL